MQDRAKSTTAMPTIWRAGPYRFYFYSTDGKEPPHVHVDRDECSIKVWLETAEVARNIRFPAHEVREIVRQVRERQADLTKAWNEYFSAGWR
jgi:hypothetical protein